MSDSSEEAEVMFPFAGTESSVEEGRLAIDEDVVGSIHTLEPRMAPDYEIAERRGEECVTRALKQLSCDSGVATHVSCKTKGEIEKEETCFVDIIGGMDTKAGGESEELKFADVLQRADSLSETNLEGLVDAVELLFLPPFFILISFLFVGLLQLSSTFSIS